MNLKLVVASMSVLGLVSCPVLASAHTKHKHHHKHTEVVQTVSKDYKDYKDMAPACVVSQNMVTFVEMNQNVGRSMPNPCNPGWWNRVSVSGGINIDMAKLGNRNQNYTGENYQRLSLNDAYLNVTADVSEWSKAFASISYNTATMVSNTGNTAAGNRMGNAEYSAAYSNNVAGSNASSAFQLEQGYMFLGNLDMSPVFLQVGKSFQDFGRYEIHPMTRSLTQVMSETLATSLKVGFIANGFNGDIAVFDDMVSKSSSSRKSTNYIASVGYDMPNEQLGWDVGVSYMYNMMGANDVAYQVVNYTGSSNYNNRIGALALYGDVNSGPFSLNARYTSALQRFNVLDMPKNGVYDMTSGVVGDGTPNTSANLNADARGAKPWAAGLTGTYGFDAWGKNQNVYVGYQTSREAAGMNLPKNRWLAGYGLDVAKNTNLGLEWDHDIGYNAVNGGNGKTTNLVTLRTSVKFG